MDIAVEGSLNVASIGAAFRLVENRSAGPGFSCRFSSYAQQQQQRRRPALLRRFRLQPQGCIRAAQRAGELGSQSRRSRPCSQVGGPKAKGALSSDLA